MHYIKIVDMNDQDHRLKTSNWDDVLAFVRKHKGAVKEIKMNRK